MCDPDVNCGAFRSVESGLVSDVLPIPEGQIQTAGAGANGHFSQEMCERAFDVVEETDE
jgi:hypothetical protein